MALRSERRFMNIDRVESGMMIEFNYRKLSGEQDSYLVLVVDPNRTNSHASEPQLHGFIIDESRLTDEELVQFIISFSTVTNLGNYEDRRRAIVEKLNTDVAYERFRKSAYVNGRPYRTFNRSKISQLRQVLQGGIE
jgi:hypothetical protein